MRISRRESRGFGEKNIGEAKNGRRLHFKRRQYAGLTPPPKRRQYAGLTPPSFPTPREVLNRLTAYIGCPDLPPAWSFGLCGFGFWSHDISVFEGLDDLSLGLNS